MKLLLISLKKCMEFKGFYCYNQEICLVTVLLEWLLFQIL